MSERQLRLNDGETVLVVDDIGSGPAVARISAVDPVHLSRADVRTLIAFLETLDD